jgi:hypothetical protein
MALKKMLHKQFLKVTAIVSIGAIVVIFLSTAINWPKPITTELTNAPSADAYPVRATQDIVDLYATLSVRWLSGNPCNPPCWEGITPGQTTLKDAVDLLQNNPLIGQLTIYADENRPNSGEISWSWPGVEKRGGRVFYARIGDVAGSVVYAIWPGFGEGVRLGEVIQAFGEPSHVKIREVKILEPPTPREAWYTYTLIWIENGFLVKGNPVNRTKIDNAFVIYTIGFFEPSMEGYIALEGNSGANPVLWHGYGDSDTYLVP